MAMIGSSPNRPSARMACVAEMPSSSGICRSISTASHAVPERTLSTASRPLAAISTVTPTASSSSMAICWLISLSSASSTFMPSSA